MAAVSCGGWSHSIYTQESGRRWEVEAGQKDSRAIVLSLIPSSEASRKLCYPLIQSHHLGNKYSNIRDYGKPFTLKLIDFGGDE